jgi:hypothetical protein
MRQVRGEEATTVRAGAFVVVTEASAWLDAWTSALGEPCATATSYAWL